jgi:putative transposase
MHIELRGRECVIGDRLPNGDYRITDLAFDEKRAVPGAELFDAFFGGSLIFLGEADSTRARRRLAEGFVDDLAMLGDDDARKREAERRFAYVNALEDSGLVVFSKRTVKPVIERVHAEIGDRKKPPFWKTLCYRWRADWIRSGKDLRAFVPHYERRGNTSPRFSNGRKEKGEGFTDEEKERAREVEKIVEEIIDEVYMSMQQNEVSDVWNALDIRIAEENQFRDADDLLPVPSRNSLHDIINAMDPYEKDKARYGEEFADRKYRSNKQGALVTRPLQRVEIDDTKLDLFVVDPDTRMPVGRPTLTFAIDCATRMPLGFYLSFDGAGYLAVMQCLIHAISRKSYVREWYPRVQHDWPCYGLPEEIVVDNGSGYISKDLEDACKQLGVTLVHCPPRTPNAKPRVERYFRRKNQGLLHKQPGTTFSDIFQRKDYDPAKNAVISFDALLEMVHIYLIDIYARDAHRGLQGVPVVAWEIGVEKHPPQLPRRQDDLRVLLARIAERQITASGIQFENLFYNCEELAALHRKGIKSVSIKYDPTDLGAIYVFDPRRDRYITVPALEQKYAKGLSLWQHQVIKRYIRKMMKVEVDTDSLRKARKTVQKVVDEERFKTGRSGTKVKVSRFIGVRQPNYNAAAEVAPGHDVAGRTLPEGDSVPMLPEAEHEGGVSDFGRDPRDDRGGDEAAESARLAMAVAGRGHKTSSGKGRRNGAKASKAVSPRPGEAAAATVAEDDDDSDIPVYSSNYELPIREVQTNGD